jgi:hypothetical protein
LSKGAEGPINRFHGKKNKQRKKKKKKKRRGVEGGKKERRTLPGGSNLDQDSLLLDTSLLVQLDELQSLLDGGLGIERESKDKWRKKTNKKQQRVRSSQIHDFTPGKEFMPRTKTPEGQTNLASTSVETRPGTIFRISNPKLTDCIIIGRMEKTQVQRKGTAGREMV